MAKLLTRLMTLGVAPETTEGTFELLTLVTATSVDADSNSGQPVLNVASTTGFAAGDLVLIDHDSSGGGAETKTILSVQAGVSLTMTANLTFTHTAAQLDTVTKGPCVDATSNSGQKVLSVNDTTLFKVGMPITIDVGGALEENGIIASVQAGVSLTMEQDLANTHTLGTKGFVRPRQLPKATVPILVYDPAYKANLSNNERTPGKQSLSSLTPISGVRSATFTFRTEVRGAVDISAGAPELDLLYKAAGFARTDIATADSLVNTDAVSAHSPGSTVITTQDGSAFQPGQRVGFGSATTQPRTVVEVSGNDITIDTALTAAVAQDTDIWNIATKLYKPVSEVGAVDVPSLSMEFRDGTMAYQVKGGKGTGSFSVDSGGIGFISWTFTASIEAVIDNKSTFDSNPIVKQPPVALSANLSAIGAIGCWSTTGWDIGNNVYQQPCGNNASGVEVSEITARAMTASLVSNLQAPEDNNVYQKWFDITTGRFSFRLGDTDSNRMWFIANTASITDITEGDDNGIRTATLAMQLAESSGGAEDEFVISYS